MDSAAAGRGRQQGPGRREAVEGAGAGGLDLVGRRRRVAEPRLG